MIEYQKFKKEMKILLEKYELDEMTGIKSEKLAEILYNLTLMLLS